MFHGLSAFCKDSPVSLPLPCQKLSVMGSPMKPAPPSGLASSFAQQVFSPLIIPLFPNLADSPQPQAGQPPTDSRPSASVHQPLQQSRPSLPSTPAAVSPPPRSRHFGVNSLWSPLTPCVILGPQHNLPEPQDLSYLKGKNVDTGTSFMVFLS